MKVDRIILKFATICFGNQQTWQDWKLCCMLRRDGRIPEDRSMHMTPSQAAQTTLFEFRHSIGLLAALGDLSIFLCVFGKVH
jgi:hypothetical protein